MRHCLLSRVAADDPLAGLLPARDAEMARRRPPVRQDGEGLPARRANSTPHPDAVVSVVVGLAEPTAVANDRFGVTYRAEPWQEMQRHYPGSLLSLASGSAIKSITAGVKARR